MALRTRSISKQGSNAFGSGCGMVFLGLFGLIFGVVGVGVIGFTSGVPLLNVFRAQGWQAATCEITFSQVTVNHGSDSDTSRIDIQYRYTWNDRVYTGKRYDFGVGSDNINDAWKREVVAAHAPGSTVPCFVDASDPTQSVINREMRWGYLFGLAFGTPFALVPVLIFGIMFWTRRSQKRREAAISAMGAVPSAAGFAPGVMMTSAAGSAFAPSTTFGSPSMSTSTPVPGLATHDGGPIELKPEISRIGKLITMIVICGFWNGIVGVFTFFEITGGFNKGSGGSGGWFVKLFLIPFQIIGALLLWGVFYTLLGMLNPKPILTLSAASVPIGGSLTLQWKMSRNAGRLKNLRILLTGREEARYRRGTDSYTDKSTFYEAQLMETSDSMRIQQGMVTVSIPANTMHSFVADDNKIIWSLQVKGEIGLWPDVDDTYDILVRPR
jgi:hypothetical protein